MTVPERVFELWGTRGGWCNQDVVGTEHRQAAFLALLDGDLDNGFDRDATAALIPEPTNVADRNAVSVVVEGSVVGYLPRDVAPRYATVLREMVSSGVTPVVPINMWARAFDDYNETADGSYITVRRHYTTARVALAEPHLLRPVNLPPPRPRAELPVGTSVKVTRTQDHFDHLHGVLGGRPAAWVYATLHRLDPVGSERKPRVEVNVSGRPAGVLTPQMSETYLPVVDRMAGAGVGLACRVLLEGSPVSVVGAMHAVRPHELTPDWLAAAGSR